MTEVNALTSLTGKEAIYLLASSHTPKHIVRLTLDWSESSVLGDWHCNSFHKQLCHFNTNIGDIRHSWRHFGDLIRLRVHQVNNELCIILLPWCYHNKWKPSNTKQHDVEDEILAVADFQKRWHLFPVKFGVSPEWHKHAGNSPIFLIALGYAKSYGGFKMPT